MDAKKTAIYDEHIALGGNMVEYAGWALPSEFTDLVDEHNAVRNAVGIFDVSHMGEIIITGPETLKFANYLITNDVNKVIDGQCQYNVMANEKGGVVDDLILCRYDAEKLLLVVNGANVDKDFEWIKEKAKEFDVVVENASSKYSEIAVQGPKAEELMQKFVDTNLSEMEYYHFKDDVDFEGKKVLISRTGYTGEAGFEVYTAWDDGAFVWKKLIEAGAKPCGLGCRDTLRFEATMPLYGNEMDEDMSPLEAGLKFAVNFKKESDFVGRSVLEKEYNDGLKKKIIGLELKGKGIPRHGYAVFKDGKEIGFVTTGYLSPTLGKPIANVIIDAEEAVIGNTVQVQVRKKLVDAELISRKFLQNK